MIDVFIADDHAVVRQGLRQILSETPGLRLAGEAASGRDTLRRARSEKWDVLVLDLGLPDVSGFHLIKELTYERPDLPVLVLTIHAETQFAIRCLEAGAAGFLTKESAPEELVAAIRQVFDGGRYISPALAGALASSLASAGGRPPHETLSDREFQVLQLMGTGKTITEIAETLSLSVKTVSTYRSRILNKLNLHSSAEIIRYAIEHHLTLSE